MPAVDPSRSTPVTSLTKHEAAVIQTLGWADEAAANHDYAGALQWLAAIEAVGDRLSDLYLGRQAAWALAARGR